MTNHASGADVLITTAFLHEGDAVDTMLRDAGLRTVHTTGLTEMGDGPRKALLAGVRAIIAGTDRLEGRFLQEAPDLRIVVRTGVGYDNVDVEAATSRGVPVCVTAGSNRQAVAEHVFALMLSAARNIPDGRDLAEGCWRQRTGRELRGATLGILGLGSIGKAVAHIARAFGMRVMAYDPHFDAEYAAAHHIERGDLEDVLREADFLTLHLFLDDSTRDLLDAAAFATMKSDAVVINTSRGGVIDEDALVAAVRSGRIGAAALDVFRVEPLPVDSPLLHTPGIITTGHIAGATREARAASGRNAADNVLTVLGGGRPAHVVNPAYEKSVHA
ncbi:phosphoglycerate dehydrogenase [Streptomyces nanshensis]|uniref:Phosphoglycerate dehydrogenase n=1 Tax=Streptomyces nanshensis TaxID=518642 RepID=A0A1E7L8C2_9ACTN|nr:phosphoglycerate dehydrogenase [Streptomyces nanshensis]OEV12410.1 phosphoglycerate dehydrogenase [Streptomyces nanshensis]